MIPVLEFKKASNEATDLTADYEHVLIPERTSHRPALLAFTEGRRNPGIRVTHVFGLVLVVSIVVCPCG